MDSASIAPVFDVIIANGLYGNGLARLSERDHQHDLITLADLQRLPKLLAVNNTEHAPAKPGLCRPQHDALGGNATIASGRLRNISVAENDDIGGRSLPFCRAIPVVNVSCP